MGPAGPTAPKINYDRNFYRTSEKKIDSKVCSGIAWIPNSKVGGEMNQMKSTLIPIYVQSNMN